jgi:hypothetical protein
LKKYFKLKQFTANIMAVDHTSEVRLANCITATAQSSRLKTKGMKQIKNNIFSFFFKKYFNFSLHSNKTTDINSIARIDVSVTEPRHCSTTFYQ